MKTITKEYKVYNYKELNETAKDRVREYLEDGIIEARFDWLKTEIEDTIKEYYNIEAKVFYSLTYSQGDGLHFETDDLFTKEFYNLMLLVIDETNWSNDDKRLATLIISVFNDYKSNLQVYSKHDHYNRYAYASKRDINVEVLDEDAFKDLSEIKAVKDWNENGNAFKTAIDLFTGVVSRAYLKICKDFEKIGYEVYNVSEKDIIEEATANEWQFLQDGSVFND
jgi:hypothetical protein